MLKVIPPLSSTTVPSASVMVNSTSRAHGDGIQLVDDKAALGVLVMTTVWVSPPPR